MTGPEQRKDGDPHAAGTLFAVVVGAVAIFVVVIALEAWFYRAEETERVSKVYNVGPEELARLRSGQLERLNSYRLVDPAAGTVTIPIERAMELVVRDQGRMPAIPQPKSTLQRAGAGARSATPPNGPARPGTSPAKPAGAGTGEP